jgi:hypothetical protein
MVTFIILPLHLSKRTPLVKNQAAAKTEVAVEVMLPIVAEKRNNCAIISTIVYLVSDFKQVK